MRPGLLALGPAALGLLVLAGPATAQGRPATCARDLIRDQAELHRREELMRALESAAPPEQCRGWREQILFLQGARAVIATCRGGREREAGVARMDQALAHHRALVAARCAGAAS